MKHRNLAVIALIGALLSTGARRGTAPSKNGPIVFTSTRGGNAQIYSVDPDGSHLTRVTTNRAHDDFPLWAPDRRHISLLSDRDGNWELYVFDTVRSTTRRLTETPAYEHSPAWAPDGRRIAFSSNREDGDWEIYVTDLDGSHLQNLTRHPGMDYSPNWSPDGRRIAFVSERDGKAAVYVMNADGSDVGRLTNGPVRDWLGSSAWSADGRRILFLSKQPDGMRLIQEIDVDGANPTTILADATLSSAGWSPDGQWVTFASSREGNSDVFVMRSDGSELANLTRNPAEDYSPDWGGTLNSVVESSQTPQFGALR